MHGEMKIFAGDKGQLGKEHIGGIKKKMKTRGAARQRQ